MKEHTVYEHFLDMIKYEQNFAAYWVYLALKRGYLQRDDPVDKIPDVQFTEEEIALIHDMNRRDVLGLNRVKLYATKVEHSKGLTTTNAAFPATYALYFAETPSDAQQFHYKIYGTRPTKWHSVYNQLLRKDLSFHKYGNEYKLYDLKQLVKNYPYYVGEIEVTG